MSIKTLLDNVTLLSKKEEKELFISLKEINDKLKFEENKDLQKQKIEIRQRILSNFLRLIANLAKRYGNHMEYEEAFGEGVIIAYRCFDAFNLTRNIQFSTYLSRSIINEFRRKYTLNSRISYITYGIPELIPDDYDYFQYLIDKDEKENNNKKIHQLLNRLNEKEKQVIKAIYGIDTKKKTYKDLGKKFSRSKQAIGMCARKAIKKLQESQ